MDPDADFCYTRVFQDAQHFHIYIFRVKLQADPLRDKKVLLQRIYDFFDAACRKGRCPAAKIEAGHRLSPCMLAAHKMDFLEQCIYVRITLLGRIPHLAIWAEIADAFAKRDMHIQPKLFTRGKRQLLVKFVSEGKGLYRPREPHSRKTCNNTHRPPKCTLSTCEASRK